MSSPPEFGASNQLELLISGLPTDEFSIDLCVLEESPAPSQEAVVPHAIGCSLRKRWNLDPLAFARLTRHMRRLRPDLVHTWEFTGGVYGRVAARIAGIPRLVHSIARVESRKPAWKWAAERRLGRSTHRVIAHGAAVRDVCVKHGLPVDQLTVIAGGVGPARPSDVSRAQLFQELNLPSDARLIGVIGHMCPGNRITDLIWAADLIRVLHDNMRLLVIGGGEGRPQLERFARLASDLDHVRFLGVRDDIWRIMPHLDVLWHGGTWEGPSQAIMQAMAAGVPVVACDIASGRELIVNGESGFLVPVAGRAARVRVTDRILREEDTSRRISDAAKARISDSFGAQAMIDRHVRLYRETVADRRT